MNFRVAQLYRIGLPETFHVASGCIWSCNFPSDPPTEPGTLAPPHSDKGIQELHLPTAAKPPIPRRIVSSAVRNPVPESSSNPAQLAPGSTIDLPTEET